MSDVQDRYHRVAAGFTQRVRECPSERWNDASPCEGWSARDVATHVIQTHQRVLRMLDATVTESPTVDDPAQEWAAVTGAVADTLADRTRASTVVSGLGGERPWDQLVGTLLCADTLLHTWDLSCATGQDDTLDAEAVDAALAFLTPIDEVIRRPGGFGPKLAPAPDADPQAQLLAFTGRQGSDIE